MQRRGMVGVVVVVAAIGVIAMISATARKDALPAHSSAKASGTKQKSVPSSKTDAMRPPKDTTLEGKVGDLRSWIVADEQADHAAAIGAGSPPVLELPTGIVILGTNDKNVTEKILPLVNQDVRVTGTISARRGFKFLELNAITKLAESAASTAKPSKGSEAVAQR